MPGIWSIQPGELPSQPALVGAGLLLAALLGPWWGRRTAGRLKEAVALTGLACVAGLVGAGLWGGVFDKAGGFASFGAMAGAATAALLWAAWRGPDSTAELLDGLVPAGLLGLAVARLGCLSAGCDYGRPTAGDWGVIYTNGPGRSSAPLHPFPLYLVGVTLLAVIVASLPRFFSTRQAGVTAFIAAQGYLVARFGVEFARHPDSVTMSWGGIGFNQVAAASGVVLLTWFWLVYRNTRKGRHHAD